MIDIIFDIIGNLIPVIAFGAGYIYRDFLLIKEMKEIANSLNQNVEQKLKKIVSDDQTLNIKDINSLKHEIISGVHYFFLESDDTFVCQGISLNEAAINYTLKNGSDILGHFQHPELKKSYCFVNKQCMEFVNE
jgi:hypothetical protein